MLQANISTIKNKLSQYIEKVVAGDEVVISDRSTPVAILIPFSPSRVQGNWSSRVAQLTKLGHLKRPVSNSKIADQINPIEVQDGTPLSKLLLIERQSGR
jgi:prevent-host-death family protein